MYRKVVLWLALYVIVVAMPLMVMYVLPRPEGRDLLKEFAVALGFVGLTLMALQFLLVARLRRAFPPFAADTIWQFHRHMGIVGVVFVLAHLLLLGIGGDSWTYLNPFVDWMRASALWTATILLVVLLVTSLWREEIRLSYEWWRLTHGLMASVVLLIGLAHVTQVGHYVSTLWHQGLMALVVVSALGFLAYIRIGKPWQMRRRPYVIAELRDQPGDVWTLSLAPDGHPGFRFEGGQYAWITLADTPFTLQQHPYSFSSSAERTDRIEFTIKALGDFSGSLADRSTGGRAYLEGPYGAFTFTDPAARGAVFIAGGIGITPVMSMLRTLHDRGDPRQFVLMYANNTREEIVFHDELMRLQQDMHLEVHHVLAEPPEDWEGLTGFLTQEILDAHLPARDAEAYAYYICGPEAMMDVAERALVKLRLPPERIHSERFAIV
jgi:predicted ferric reductase